MYTKEELLDGIEAAKQNIKVAKRQLKRLEKARSVCYEIESDNKFGYEHSIDDVLFGFGFSRHLEKVISDSTVNLKRYRKMLRLLDKMESMSD